MSGPVRAMISVVASASFFLVLTPRPMAQNSKGAAGGVTLVKLSEPRYPQLARTTHISGSVVLELSVRQDGSVESASVISGHPLLQQVALDSANHSQFECSKCNEGTTSYRMIYTFQLIDSDACCSTREANANTAQKEQITPGVIQQANRVTVIDRPFCTCDPGAEIKVRSLKCLYLWRCGVR